MWMGHNRDRTSRKLWCNGEICWIIPFFHWHGAPAGAIAPLRGMGARSLGAPCAQVIRGPGCGISVIHDVGMGRKLQFPAREEDPQQNLWAPLGQQMDFTKWISPMPIMPIAQNICGSGFPISTRSFGGNMPQSRIEARPEPEHSGHFERWPSCPFRGYFYKLITFW